jgi:hypothetical protein
MQSKEVADNDAEIDARRAQVDASLGCELRAESDKHCGPVAGRLDGLGTALIEMYETGAEHPTKIDLLDQVVSIIRRKKRSDERIRDIANLMRATGKQMRHG